MEPWSQTGWSDNRRAVWESTSTAERAIRRGGVGIDPVRWEGYATLTSSVELPATLRAYCRLLSVGLWGSAHHQPAASLGNDPFHF